MATTYAKDPQLDPDRLWSAVLSRDPSFDGRFVYAVRSTGVFCRPTCPSRRPKQSQAVFFAVPEEACTAGYRPCLRCRPHRSHEDAELVQRVCDYIDEWLGGHDSMPSLAELTEATGVAGSRLRRVFMQKTGLSPAQYARGRRQERFKAMLREGAQVSEALYEAGYSSPSRLYENVGEQLGMSPATYRKGGAGAVIWYVFTESALGGLLVAATTSGVCAIKLGDDSGPLIAELKDEFPAADLRPADSHVNQPEVSALRDWTGAIQEYLDGRLLNVNLPLDVLATVFQWRVWRQLQAIPVGQTRTYQQLAEELEHPTASRAVGRACATNPVAPIVPCHRAVRKDGGLAGYRWGLHRKEALLEMERRQSA